MEEMDDYAKRLQEGVEKRSKSLGISNMPKAPLGKCNTAIVADTKLSRTTSHDQTTAFQIDAKENNDLAFEISITTGTNVQVQVAVEEHQIDGDGNVISCTTPSRRLSFKSTAATDEPTTSSTACIRDSSRNRLQRLGALYSDTENLSSPIHRTEANFMVEQPARSVAPVRRARFAKLTELAQSINTWEDDLSHSLQRDNDNTNNLRISSPTVAKKHEPRIVSVLARTEQSPRKDDEKNDVSHTNMVDAKGNRALPMKWEKKVMDAIDSQEFRRRDATNKPAASTSSPAHRLNGRMTANSSESSKTQVTVTKGLVSGRAAIFEKTDRSNGGARQKDPAEMSLKERLALFERNKGTALIPKAAFGMAPSAKQILPADKNHPAAAKPILTTPQRQMIGSSIAASTGATPAKVNDLNKSLMTGSNAFDPDVAPDIPKMPKSDFSDCTTNVKHKRRSDGGVNTSPSIRDFAENVKRVKINPPRCGQIYPSLSDIDSEAESGGKCETSERDAVLCDDGQLQSVHRYLNSFEVENDDDIDDAQSETSCMESDASASNSEYEEIDDYLDEALGVDGDGNSSDDDAVHHGQLGPNDNSPGGSMASNSFCFERKPTSTVRHQTIKEGEIMELHNSNYASPFKSSVNPSAGKNSAALTHTVSFYRRQQSNSANATPVQKTLYHSNDDTESSTDSDGSDDAGEGRAHDDHARIQMDVVDGKIKRLSEIVTIQQQQIAQASNALTTCASTFEFSGSTESVVAEWKLLIATHCRLAALNEVQRLRIERCLRPVDAPTECGRLTLREIILPLKQDYVDKLSTDQISGHHLVCLLKYNEQVLATKTIPTVSGLLSVRFPDVLKMDSTFVDFKMKLEIYGMEAQREVLPHDIKYRIKNKKGIIKTPKGKKTVSRLIMPPRQSPGGPYAIRSPSFVHFGFVVFSLREVQRTSWTLNQVSGVCPLVGTVHMKLNYEFLVNIDHKGFLTMFDDISGFGAWHRRWCRLHGNNSNNIMLNYWKYPDDERKHAPIGCLDLSACEQKTITTAPRDVCARPNTMLLELKRPRRDDDQDSLVLVTQGDHTIVRHLLSADTKEERNEWIAHFTKALALMRGWSAQR